MEVRIGIVNSPREISVELEDGSTIENVKAAINAAVAAGEGLVWLTDKKGRETGFPADRIAFVELGNPSEDQRIGFS